MLPFPNFLASLNNASLASPPLLQKKHLPGMPTSSTSRLANKPCGSV
jgi:hypothetical protein